MNRLVLFIAIVFIIGIAAAHLFGVNYAAALLIFVIAAGVYIIFYKKRDKLILLLFACLGLLLFSYQNTYFPPNDIKNFVLIEEVKTIKAIVDSDPESNEDRTYFYANIISVNTKNAIYEKMTGKIRVTLEKSLGAIPSYGDVVIIKGKLKIPEGPKNPGEFDYKKYLSLKRVYFTVYVKDTSCNKTGEIHGNWFYKMSYKAKDKLLSIIYKSIPKTEAEILDGLLLGNQRIIPDDTYDKFKITGTVHILAVSGMNVGMIAFFVFLLLKLLKINRKACAVITMFLITGFMIITGAGASIVRATIMSYILLIGILIERDVDVLTSLSAAALLILFFNPASLFDVGFQLSFLATAGIIYFMDWADKLFPEMPIWIKATLATTLSAQLFLTPVMINTFHQLSLISVVANMIIVPLSGTISILGYAMWLIGMIFESAAKIFGASIWVLIKLMMFSVDIMAAIPYASISVKTLPWLYTAAYYIFFITLPYKDVDIIIKKISMKKVIGVLLCIWAIVHVVLPAQSALYCPSVKGINAALIQTKDNKKILMLGCDNFRAAQAVRGTIVPYLRNLGINNIDSLILYSVNEKKNLEALKRSFIIKSVYTDSNVSDVFNKAEIIDAEFYLKEGSSTFMNLSSNRADITTGSHEFIFAKTADFELLKRQGAQIYLCNYDDAKTAILSKNNTCIINSGAINSYRKKKAVEKTNIQDTAVNSIYNIYN